MIWRKAALFDEQMVLKLYEQGLGIGYITRTVGGNSREARKFVENVVYKEHMRKPSEEGTGSGGDNNAT